jgi:pimeloyl-ACP methyl ester carboxylesterase
MRRQFTWARRRNPIACPTLVLLLASPLWAQTGARIVTFRSTVDHSEQPYALYVPHDFDPAKKYPLLISLHSEDTNHRINLRQVFGLPIRSGENNGEDLRQFPARDAGFLVAAPLARGSMDYRGIAERDVFDVLEDVGRRYPVDPDRLYLTGISMGGAAALRLALTRPDLWAAVAPVCPAEEAPLADLAPNALDLPIRIFQGDQDPIVPVENARLWQRRLVDAGAPAEYIEYPGVRHNAWDLAYRGGAMFEWLGQFHRNRFPDRVRLAARSYRDASAYWLRIGGLTPGALASVDATRIGAAEIVVQTSGVEGFTLSLDRPASSVAIDGAALRVRPSASLSFVKAAGKWRAGSFEPAGKRPGAEGPIVEAVAGRSIYVYGSAGAATAGELEARKKVAEAAAAWSSPRSRLPVSFPVEADAAVTEEDIEDADLVLFGTRETNSVIARLAPRLPLALNAGAADYGLLFIAPAGKHYALVSSGLPWWTGAEEAKRGGPPLAPEQYRLLSTFGDYILFKGSLANVVAEGRFDSNWKVPAGDAAKMLATGTVTIH